MARLVQSSQNREPLIQNFVKIKDLGAGQYGNVFLAIEKFTNFVCAIKEVKKKHLIEEGIVDQFIREVKIQMFLNHPNILKLYGLMHDQNSIYIILEAGMDKELHQLLHRNKILS